MLQLQVEIVFVSSAAYNFLRNKFLKVGEAEKKSSLERRPPLGVYTVLACNIVLVVGQ